jgi:glutathione peroxidase
MYKSRGFVVLAFPSNDYHQEKETDKEILDYVQTNFPQVNFPIFSKSALESNVVFQMCKRHTGEVPEWNFHKYLVNGEGRAVKSFGHRVSPLEMEEDIIKLLEENEEKKNHVVPQIS